MLVSGDLFAESEGPIASNIYKINILEGHQRKVKHIVLIQNNLLGEVGAGGI